MTPSAPRGAHGRPDYLAVFKWIWRTYRPLDLFLLATSVVCFTGSMIFLGSLT